MKLSGAALVRFLKNPDPNISVVLLYGPDRGLIGERATLLVRRHLGETPGPFSQTSLSDNEIKSDPAVLHDTLCALPLGGGACVIRLKTNADSSAKAVKALLAALAAKELAPAALLLIEAGELSPRSILRKSIEQDKVCAVGLACYAPNLRDLRELAIGQARDNALRFSDDALDLLVNRLPPDRAIARSEINKLVLYCGQENDGSIGVADVEAIIVDGLGHNLDDFVFAVTDRAFSDADRLLNHALEAGQSPVALLRALQRHFLRLSEAKTALEGGKDIKAAMASLRPPVFFAYQLRFSRQFAQKSHSVLVRMSAYCLATECAIKRSGSLPKNLLARLVIKLAA